MNHTTPEPPHAAVRAGQVWGCIEMTTEAPIRSLADMASTRSVIIINTQTRGKGGEESTSVECLF